MANYEHLVELNIVKVARRCTEIPLLISQADSDVPLFDTTTIHAEAALNYALSE